MDRRAWMCAAVVASVALALGFVVHGLVLRADYLAVHQLFRSQAAANAQAGWIVVAYACIGGALTWLYMRLPPPARSRRGHGLRFGLACALLSFVPWHLLAFAGQPLPLALTAKQVVLDTASMMLLGMLLAWLDPSRVALREPPR
jgi:hypothetical protein